MKVQIKGWGVVFLALVVFVAPLLATQDPPPPAEGAQPPAAGAENPPPPVAGPGEGGARDPGWSEWLKGSAKWILASLVWLFSIAVIGRVLRPAIAAGIAEGLGTALTKAIEQAPLSDFIAATGTGVKDLLAPEIRNLSASFQNELRRLSNSLQEKPLSVLLEGQSVFVPRVYPDEEDEIARELKRVDEILESGERENAFQRLRQIREQHPEDFRAYGKRVQYDLEAGRGERAREFLLQHGDIFADHWEYFHLLGTVYQQLNDLENALEAKCRAVEIQPEEYTARTALAYGFWKNGQLQEAAQEAEKALELARKQETTEAQQAEIRNSLAFYLAERGYRRDENQAKQLIESALSADRDAFFLDTKGYVLMSFATTVKDIGRAIEIFGEALDEGLDPTIGTDHLRQAYEKRKELARGGAAAS